MKFHQNRRGACGRPFEEGRRETRLGAAHGCRNKKTIAAAALLEGESEALTRKAVELAMLGDPTAMMSERRASRPTFGPAATATFRTISLPIRC